MFGHDWKVARVAGIEIRVDASWAIIAILIAWSLWLRFDFLYADLWSGGALAVLAVAAALVFFLSVLLHELAHSVTANARGIPVRGITLFLFGGATHAKVESREPRDEFVITIVGPLSSLAIGGVLGAVAVFVGPALAAPVAGAVGYLAWVNVALAVFNLLPGLPLDGGRVLRAAVWHFTGSIGRATRVAARGGEVLAFGLIGLGVVTLLSGGIGGIWFAAIGWFLLQAARAAETEQVVRRVLGGLEAEDVMSPEPVALPADIPVTEAIDRWFLRYDHGAFPVNEDGRTVGLLTLRRVRRIPPDERPGYRVRDVMVGLEDAVTIGLHESMDRVVSMLEDDDVNRVLVVEDDRVVGLIGPGDIARWLQRWEALSPDGGPARGPLWDDLEEQGSRA